MKVAYLVNRYPAPTHTFIRREIDALEALGVDIVRVSIRPGDDADADEHVRVRVVLDVGAPRLAVAVITTLLRRPAIFGRALLTALRLGWRSDRGVLRHLGYFAEACVLTGWLEREGVEHLHAHFGTNPAAVALLVRRLGGPPYSFTVHGPEELDHPAELKLESKVAGARFVVAISDFARSQVWRWSDPADWDRVHVVRCGVDAGYLDAAPEPVPDTVRLVTVGRLSQQKGQVLLVQAVGRLLDEGVAVELVIIGEGPMRADVDRAIDATGHAGAFTIVDRVPNDEVAAMMRSARAVVLPSFAEGLPVTLMEALALGRPVVTTAIAGIPELVRDGESGWLVAAGAIDPLVDALREVLRTPVDELTRMGKVGAAAVGERHDARVEAGKLLELLRAT